MSRKRYTPEQIIGMLREADVALAQGEKVGQICRRLGISEQSYYRWRRGYDGLKVDQAKRLKELEKENARLRQAVSDLTLDKQILKEAARGPEGQRQQNFRAPPAAGSASSMSGPTWTSRSVARVVFWARTARRSASRPGAVPTRRWTIAPRPRKQSCARLSHRRWTTWIRLVTAAQ